MLTKTGFIKYLQCPKALWLYKHRPDLIPKVDDNKQAIFDTVYEVESYAYKLFPGGSFALEEGDDFWGAIDKTKKLINNKEDVIYQPSFLADNLFCRSDILKYNRDNNSCDIIEVKSSTQAHDIYYKDLAFQKICLETSGLKVGRIFLIYINNQY